MFRERPVSQRASSLTVIKSDSKTVILVVEDDQQLRKFYRINLEREGYGVLLAGSGLEALTVARAYTGRIHLLLSGIEMPDATGLELARQLTYERPGIRVLLTSGNLAYAGESEFPFLEQPFLLEELRVAVSEAIETPAETCASPVEGAASDLTSGNSQRESPWWLAANHAPAWAAAAAIILAMVPLGYHLSRSSVPETIHLYATRGLAVGTPAKSAGPIVLDLDISGLPWFDSYRVDLVDDTGHISRSRPLAAEGAEIRTKSMSLHAGEYFIRAYSPSGEILREYALKVTGNR